MVFVSNRRARVAGEYLRNRPAVGVEIFLKRVQVRKGLSVIQDYDFVGTHLNLSIAWEEPQTASSDLNMRLQRCSPYHNDSVDHLRTES